MAGFYERMKEAWNKIKDTLRPGRKVELEPYEKLCSRFESSKPISISELDDIKELCKAIVEPRCEKRIDDGFEMLKKMGAEKAERGIGAKRKRNECVGDAKGERKTKKHRKRGYQKKYALKKENDVSWGILPKKYRVEGKTPMETIEKAICYDEEDNLFLHLGEVSTDEEEEYFCEKNVKKLNSEKVDGKVQCNFGGDYNCKRCVEYEIRKEYEAKEKERRREERERTEKRRKMARERWESRVPRSYFYLEKDLGVDRMMARYVTDDKFDIDDLEEGERKKLTNVLSQAKKERLFDIETLGNKSTSFDKNEDEVSKARIAEASEKNDGKNAIPEVSWSPNTKGNGIDVAPKANGVSNSSVAPSHPILDPVSEDKENGSDTGQGEIDLDTKKDESTVPPRKPFVFGGTLSETVRDEEKESLSEDKKNEEPKKFGFWDGRTPSLEGNAPAFQFNSSISNLPTQGSPSTVNHESITSPFASDVKAPETKPFVFGGGSTLQPCLGNTQGSTELHSPSPGSSLFKRKLNGSGEVSQKPETAFPFGQEGNVFLQNNNGTSSNIQSFSSIGSVGQGHLDVSQQTDTARPISNMFGNGKSLFGGLFEGTEPSQQPAKPSIGYADSNERNESGVAGLFGSGGIFNAADDDPFERNKFGGRR
ncbi:hypothetical protein EROM_091010 [Encephalitozoon romaleae SJ-2008]|uniref:Uncharacterized protein n=1 Tax=Encephalitozoon romaleae (strain SJ-2008) TaxID=1178016 RepID=I7ATF2_ENCRO|nr:hypothetical protein EROM_091010 [Encephalitozoon romaleae SJ-2008]AFN83717.1 hypothetical protein EROM_091010 [Encephalitozoon romaleae SJ-2008]